MQKSIPDSMAVSLTREQIAELRAALMEGERLLSYAEMAQRMAVSVDTVRGMVACRLIRPALNRGNVVRFHWPSVVQQLMGGRFVC